MSDEPESLTLKWGSIKGWSCAGNEKMLEALKRWGDTSPEYQAMRRNTPDQAVLICEVIDACNGEIWNDWDGVIMTKEAAKEYVMGYGKKQPAAPAQRET